MPFVVSEAPVGGELVAQQLFHSLIRLSLHQFARNFRFENSPDIPRMVWANRSSVGSGIPFRSSARMKLNPWEAPDLPPGFRNETRRQSCSIPCAKIGAFSCYPSSIRPGKIHDDLCSRYVF